MSVSLTPQGIRTLEEICKFGAETHRAFNAMTKAVTILANLFIDEGSPLCVLWYTQSKSYHQVGNERKIFFSFKITWFFPWIWYYDFYGGKRSENVLRRGGKGNKNKNLNGYSNSSLKLVFPLLSHFHLKCSIRR